MFQGKIAAQGSPDDLTDIGIDLVNFATFKDETENPENGEKYVRQLSKLSISSSLNGSFGDGLDIDMDGAQFEASSKGSAKNLASNYFRAAANWPALVAILLSFVIVQFLASFSDFWVSVW